MIEISNKRKMCANRLLAIQNKVLYSYFAAALGYCTYGIDIII